MNIKKYQINKNNKFKTLYLGFFDALHLGHVNLFKNKKDNDAVMTFINIPRKSEPVFNIEKRINDLKKIGFKKIYIYDIVSKNIKGKDFIEKILINNGVNKIIVGNDFKLGSDFIDIDEIKKYINVDVIEKNNISTTQIKELLKNGNLLEANKKLAFNFSIKAKVIKSKQIARTLGFPTANIISYNSHYLKQGVYKTYTIINNKKYNSITFVGNNKTFEDNTYSIETHIFDFNQNIYNKNIEVFFIDYVSDIFKFNSTNELKKHINNLVNKLKNNI